MASSLAERRWAELRPALQHDRRARDPAQADRQLLPVVAILGAPPDSAIAQPASRLKALVLQSAQSLLPQSLPLA